MPVSKIATEDVARFNSKWIPEPNSGCWLWIGALDKQTGYSAFKFRRKKINAHRFAYLLHKGEIPAGADLDHLCRVRSCVNPHHLEIVSRAENARRGDGTKLAVEQVRAIFVDSRSQRRIASEYGLSHTTISHIKNRLIWSDVTTDLTPHINRSAYNLSRFVVGCGRNAQIKLATT